jgi:hypothetical protein
MAADWLESASGHSWPASDTAVTRSANRNVSGFGMNGSIFSFVVRWRFKAAGFRRGSIVNELRVSKGCTASLIRRRFSKEFIESRIGFEVLLRCLIPIFPLGLPVPHGSKGPRKRSS